MKEPVVLLKLRPEHESAFHQALAAWTDPDFVFANGFKEGLSFSHYLQALEDEEMGVNLAAGRVPSSLRFAFLGDQIVGRTSIRHRLNDALMRVGGHVGYAVLPEFRRRGFATSILRQSLNLCRELGLSRVLLTCDDHNLGSICVIENCGGVLENQIEDGGKLKRRYWIEL